jgi:hypothetical protein
MIHSDFAFNSKPCLFVLVAILAKEMVPERRKETKKLHSENLAMQVPSVLCFPCLVSTKTFPLLSCGVAASGRCKWPNRVLLIKGPVRQTYRRKRLLRCCGIEVPGQCHVKPDARDSPF